MSALDKKRNRRPVVCNVCRKRKVKCDRAKPACSACRKSNCVHLCIYEEREGRRGRLPAASSSPPGSPATGRDDEVSSTKRSATFNLKQKNAVSTSVPKEKQQRLQKEHQQFQLQFQQQQHYQHNLQSQMAAKYGVTGGNSSQTASPIQIHHQPQQPPVNPYQGMPFSQHHQHQQQQQPAPSLGQFNPDLQQYPSHGPPFIPWAQAPMIPQAHYQQQQFMFDPNGAQFQPQYAGVPPSVHQQFPIQQHPHQQPQQQQQQQQQVLLPPQAAESFSNVDLSKNGQTDITDEEENIDPSLYDADEITNIFQEFAKNSEFVDVETDGLFGNGTLIRKDVVSTLFYLNLKKYNETHEPSSNNKYSRLLSNQRDAKLDDYLKHHDLNLNEILKKIGKLLPAKKIILSLVEKFFTGLSDLFLPILNEGEFNDFVSKLVGSKDMVNEKVRLNIDLENNEELVLLFYLVVIIRVSQYSLSLTGTLDKQSNFLMKNSSMSNEWDLIIDIFFTILSGLKISRISSLKITLFKEFINLVDFNGDPEVIESAPLAVHLNLNNKHLVRSDTSLTQTWFLAYFSYYYTHLRRGYPLLYGKDFFNLQCNFKNSLKEDYTLQIGTNEIYKKLFDRIYDYSANQGIPIKNLTKWMNDLDGFLGKRISSTTYKNDIVPIFPRKILNTFLLLISRFVNLNLHHYILIHYENVRSRLKVLEGLKHAIKIIHESVDMIFDVLKNYSSYFLAGNEFLIYPSILTTLDKVLQFLQNVFIRSYLADRPSVTALKTIINIVDELDGFPALKNYFIFNKISLRSKSFLQLFKSHHERKISILDRVLVFEDGDEKKTVTFSDIKSNIQDFSKEEFLEIDKEIESVNEKFDSKYSELRTIDEFFQKLECEEVEFNLELFK